MNMKLLYAMSLVAVFALGRVSASWSVDVVHAQANPSGEKAAYLIAASSPVQASPERMAKYREVALPLAQRAGLQILAGGEPGKTLQVLEGKWPYDGRVGIERFRSMKALLEFWNSPAYQEARKLRTEAHFIIAVEATQ